MIDERKRAQETGEEHSIFTFHADVNRDQQRVRLAKNGARRMKTLRHPNVLLVKDVIEIESGNELTIHVVTEAVTPLEAHLRDGVAVTVSRRRRSRGASMAWPRRVDGTAASMAMPQIDAA